MVRQQLELDGVPRKRIALVTEEELAREGAPVVEVREIFVEAFIGLTDWEHKEHPPCSGYWDVTDRSTETVEERRWFDLDGLLWWTPSVGGMLVNAVEAHLFRMIYSWRGLKAPHPDGYGQWPYVQTVDGAVAYRYGPGKKPRVALES
jgi:hypothetical protein